MHFTFRPKGVCSQKIELEIEDGVILSAEFAGGCSGNLQGVCSLIRDCRIEDVIPKIRGIRCGFKATSCPDQLSKALEEALEASKAAAVQ